ncbi:hypothetical protein LZ554_001028 [Drepanopeziza brunnea f. sp. 'monogermtubi']|nr:hypothetical protein LZ554_001028 [Drepanopeziza brunnea f. sp. 'monogermtubi']
MLSEQQQHTTSWLENGQLTPELTTRAHHRESSLSSLGSAGPSSPYTANAANPLIVGDYHEYQDYQPNNSSTPLTPAHTPSQAQFLTPQYSSYYQSSNLSYTTGYEALPKGSRSTELMAASESHHSGRPPTSSEANESPSTPPSYDEERQNIAYRSTAPKLERTITDMYTDELYNPNVQFTTAPSSSTSTTSPQNDLFCERLQAANSQHLSANVQTPLSIPSRERSPFRHGSPLAPTGNTFGTQTPVVRFNSAQHLRQQQKMESDAMALQQQMERVSTEHSAPKTISPKEVDLVYHENDDDANAPLFPPQQNLQNQPQPSTFRQQPALPQDLSEDENASQTSYGNMATTGLESSSAYSNSSQATQHQSNFNFVTPAVTGSIQQIPQQYPFVPASRRQPSNLSNFGEDVGFPSTLTSMESSSSEYTGESDTKKPAGTSADTGTYTCTYHGCTLRFDTPARLQRHKREGHRNSAVIGSGDEGGMTSTAQRNSQAGPHKCERINPSTGKPCNTIFSRPYDLTRHEDTIHNARKLKVHCPLCTEEKTFSRNDALTRHMRVVHPEHTELNNSRRRAHD